MEVWISDDFWSVFTSLKSENFIDIRHVSVECQLFVGFQQSVFCGAHHTPGLGTLGANVVIFQINGRDGRIFLQRLGQHLEAATHQGWCLNFRALLEKPDC